MPAKSKYEHAGGEPTHRALTQTASIIDLTYFRQDSIRCVQVHE